MIVPIASAADPRLAPYLAVKERDLVQRDGRFIVEGRVTLARLIEASRFAIELPLPGCSPPRAARSPAGETRSRDPGLHRAAVRDGPGRRLPSPSRRPRSRPPRTRADLRPAHRLVRQARTAHASSRSSPSPTTTMSAPASAMPPPSAPTPSCSTPQAVIRSTASRSASPQEPRSPCPSPALAMAHRSSPRSKPPASNPGR